jgi:hypothetical protein
VLTYGTGGCREAAAGQAGGRCTLAKEMGHPSSTCSGGFVEQAYAPHTLQPGRREGLPPLLPPGECADCPYARPYIVDLSSNPLVALLPAVLNRSANNGYPMFPALGLGVEQTK